MTTRDDESLARISDAITQMIRLDLDDELLMSWIEYLSRNASGVDDVTSLRMNAEMAEAIVRNNTPKG